MFVVMSDADRIVADAKAPEKTVELCLRSDVVAELEDVQRRLVEARQRERSSLGDDGGTADLLAEAERLKVQAREHTIVFRFRALNRYRMQTLMAESPPRDGYQQDKRLGYNVDRVTYRMMRDCCYEPELSDESWDRLIGTEDAVGDGVLSPGQWQQVDEVLSALNFSRSTIPF